VFYFIVKDFQYYPRKSAYKSAYTSAQPLIADLTRIYTRMLRGYMIEN